jgi:hypothetical protein
MRTWICWPALPDVLSHEHRLLSIAEIEWQYTRERQVAGIALAKQKGVYTDAGEGRPRPRRRGAPLTEADYHMAGLTPDTAAI